ncbi:hypothetical protein [Sandaracinus amylolyticus]|uniref:hypothetical protein n=1 Tax=Sandaracinus amylolyticus TaxID=927083 RepID=UPI001F2C26F6|nr:hypothetical protein [Sandaracinus amylolyticus]UJR80697.1 Hypothetical protein I5071_27460 [Sandaracinus amylolyticus]
MPFRIVPPALVLVAALSTPALAQSRTGERLDPAIERRVSGEATVGVLEPYGSHDRLYGALGVYASGRLHTWDEGAEARGIVELDGTLRGFFGEVYDDAGSLRCCAIASSTLSLMIGWTDGASVRVRGGPAITLPFAMLNSRASSAQYLTQLALAATGFWDAWEGFALGPSALARADVDVRSGVLIAGADLAAGAAFWLWRDGFWDEPPIAVAHYQIGGYVGIEPIEWLALGTRVQVAGWSDYGDGHATPSDADAQVSLVPFARWMGPPWFVEVRGTMNLDEPVGFASRSLMWGVRLAAGVELEP